VAASQPGNSASASPVERELPCAAIDPKDFGLQGGHNDNARVILDYVEPEGYD
jgi:hypothetical protein